MAARVEAEMADLEVAAIATAEPTPYAHEVIASARESGRTVAVVSNNSSHAVSAYLERHDLISSIRLVATRTHHDPALLKPSPQSLHMRRHAVSLDAAVAQPPLGKGAHFL
jgi:phosphoglycolate phosphatase